MGIPDGIAVVTTDGGLSVVGGGDPPSPGTPTVTDGPDGGTSSTLVSGNDQYGIVACDVNGSAGYEPMTVSPENPPSAGQYPVILTPLRDGNDAWTSDPPVVLGVSVASDGSWWRPWIQAPNWGSSFTIQFSYYLPSYG
jgi:hypothetical protein